jgi:hypothetical protein
MFARIKPLKPNDISAKYASLRHFLRVTAATVSLLLIGEGVPAPVYADAAVSTSSYLSAKTEMAKQKIHSYEVMRDLRAKMSAVKPADFVQLSRPVNLPLGRSFVDEVGKLTRPIAPSYADTWTEQLHNAPAIGKMTSTQVDYYAQRHLWLG